MISVVKSAAYRALDLCTAGRGVPRRVGGHAIRFPARWCRYYEAEYEPETFRFLAANCREGSTVLDIGAHIGLFTVVMARLVGAGGRVLSFEPTPSTCEILETTVRLNGLCDRVEVRAEAVTKEVGQAHFYCTGDDVSNANSLVAPPGEGAAIQVPTTTVDAVARKLGGRIALLKVDAEGAEFEVLSGAREVYAADRPALCLALHPAALQAAGATLPGIWDLLEEYQLEVRCGGAPVARQWFCRQENLFDVQAIPAQ